MVHDDDQVQSIIMDSDDGEQVTIWKIRNDCYLICLLDPLVEQKLYMTELENALDMIEQSKCHVKIIVTKTAN